MSLQGTLTPRRKTSRSARRTHAPVDLLEEALAPIQKDLRLVSETMLACLADPVARRVVYLIAAGGKRLRPALVLLAGTTGPSPNRQALIETAAAVELIHTATLIHDDIIDHSRLRRSQPTFHMRWGTERAVLMGDYLYATAFTQLARLGAPDVVRVLAEVCQQLSRGELREVEARYRLDLSESEYLEIIRDKTASLVGGCCQCGALLGGCEARTVERLATYGINFGLAFQIIDDCLDLTGDQGELGKSIHADLDKGAMSLPIIYLAQTLTARERQRLFAPLRPPASHIGWRSAEQAVDPDVVARIAEMATACGAIAKARERASSFVRLAQQAIVDVPMNGLGGVYKRLAEYAVARRS
jgi:geranylgeranyl pyrophosphate synthase